MRTYAVLIDAGFLKRKLGSRKNPMDADRAVQFVRRLRSSPAYLTRLNRESVARANPAGLIVNRSPILLGAPPLPSPLPRGCGSLDEL